MKYHVHFLTDHQPLRATYRLRVLKPMELLRKARPDWLITGGTDIPESADVFILSKHYLMQEQEEVLARGKAKTIFDVSTDHFIREERARISKIIGACNEIVACSEGLITRIEEELSREARWVKDPISHRIKKPKEGKRSDEPVWFGHAGNQAGLLQWLPHLKQRTTTIISNGLTTEMTEAAKYSYQFVQFSPTNLELFLNSAKIALCAYDAKNPLRQSSSTNRVVDAIAAGCFPILNELGIYKELSNFVAVCNEPEHIDMTLDYHLRNEDSRRHFVSLGQEYLKEHYSDEVITKQWLQAIES